MYPAATTSIRLPKHTPIATHTHSNDDPGLDGGVSVYIICENK